MFFRKIKSLREALKEQWADGQFTAAFTTEMLAKNAGATGACSAYGVILEFEAEDIFGDDDGK